MTAEPKKRYPLFQKKDGGADELLGVFSSAKRARKTMASALTKYPSAEIIRREKDSLTLLDAGAVITIHYSQIRMDEIISNNE